jgi:hypothetical protein
VVRAQDPAPPCWIDFRVYDPFGERLAFEISKVGVEDADVDLLTTDVPEVRMAKSGARLYFPKSMIGGRLVDIVLKDKNGKGLTARMGMTACEARVSLRYGSRGAGGDLSWSTLEGQLTGCRWDDNWWVRMMPMFGLIGQAEEGYVHASDGKFEVNRSFNGERYILVIGWGKEPVRAVGVNLTEGKNDAGVIDLAGACPVTK